MKIKIISHFFLLLAIISVGCSQQEDSAISVEIKAYQLIDEGRTAEAIELLETELEGDSNNYNYKTILASAYAHKGGIRIQKLIPIVQKSYQMNDFLENGTKDSSCEEKECQRKPVIENNFARELFKLSTIISVFDAIPEVASEEQVYLENAIEILNELGSTIKPEDALYRAVLSVVILKTLFVNKTEGAITLKMGCNISLDYSRNYLATSEKLLVNIMNDLMIAQPSKKEELLESQKTVKTTINSLDRFLQSQLLNKVDLSDEFRNTANELGLGNILKCGESAEEK